MNERQSVLFLRSIAPQLLSVGIHVILIGLALIPWASTLPPRPKFNETAVALYAATGMVSKILLLPPGTTGGGGGGNAGRHQPLVAFCRGAPINNSHLRMRNH
jgi:hypothetical protein